LFSPIRAMYLLLTLSRLLHKLLIINKYYLSIQNFKYLIISYFKPLILNIGLKQIVKKIIANKYSCFGRLEYIGVAQNYD